jgi:hypothetical protein
MISLSVIVCTRNRPQQLRDCLVRIGSLVPPAGVTVEVLVVNNGPRDGVADLVAEVAQASPLSFHYLEEPARGLAHGRNRGLRAACGRLIAFTDDCHSSTRVGVIRYPPQGGGQGISPSPNRLRAASRRASRSARDASTRLCSEAHAPS